MPKARKTQAARERIGDLPPRYDFMPNTHAALRLSKCPRCNKLTYPRKFALLIGVKGGVPYVQGKTCKYCSRCELIMVQQAELEDELFRAFTRIDPALIGNDYMVLGTVDLKVWKKGMEQGGTFEDMLAHTAGFKKYSELSYDPGGWRPAGAPPRMIPPTPPDTAWRRAHRARESSAKR